MKNSGTLLVDEPVLVVIPSLARLVGLAEAIIIQQVHWWLMNRKVGRWADGRKWVRNTHQEWADNFPFWSVRHIRRVMSKLVDQGLLLSRSDLNKEGYDQTLWWSVDYQVLESRLNGQLDHLEDFDRLRGGQDVQPGVDKMTRGGGQNDQGTHGQDVHPASGGGGGQNGHTNTIERQEDTEGIINGPSITKKTPSPVKVQKARAIWASIAREVVDESGAMTLASHLVADDLTWDQEGVTQAFRSLNGSQVTPRGLVLAYENMKEGE